MKLFKNIEPSRIVDIIVIAVIILIVVLACR